MAADALPEQDDADASSWEALPGAVLLLHADGRAVYVNAALCAVGGRSPADRERAMLWILNQSDGSASLLDIAQRSGLGYESIQTAAKELTDAGLLAAANKPAAGKRKTPARRAPLTRRSKSASGDKR